MPDIDFQKIELNLIPKKGDEPVVFYASQYETARPFKADLMWGDTAFTPGDDCWAEIDIRKNDDNLVVITEDVVIDNNEVSVILPVQAVTCIGKNIGQVKIYSGEDQFVAAFNFILEVQPDTLAGGVTSDTAIDNLTQQIEDIAEEVIGENYYNKTETDALLADKADRSELSALASKAELEHAIEEEDAAVKDWVSSHFATPDYVASHYYTKLQVDGIIDNMLPVGSASGNPCTFNTEIAAELQALTVDITASGGGGTPSTPIPIVGHSELNLARCGKNFFNASEDNITEGFNICTISGNVITNTGANAYDAVRFEQPLKDGNYVIHASNISANGVIRLDYYDGSYQLLGFMSAGSPLLTFTMPANATLRISLYSSQAGGMSVTELQCELGSTPSAYAPYNGDTFTVSFGQTVYGGVYDKSGRLTIDTVKVVLNGTQPIGMVNWNPNTNTRAWVYFLTTFPHLKDYEIKDSNISSCKLKADKLQTVTYKETNGISTNDIPSISIVGGDYWSIVVRVNDTTLENETAINNYLSQNPIEVVYELATPIVIDVPSISVFAEKGVNNITSDCGGDVNVSYKDTIQHYIDTRL